MPEIPVYVNTNPEAWIPDWPVSLLNPLEYDAYIRHLAMESRRMILRIPQFQRARIALYFKFCAKPISFTSNYPLDCPHVPIRDFMRHHVDQHLRQQLAYDLDDLEELRFNQQTYFLGT